MGSKTPGDLTTTELWPTGHFSNGHF